ncbi:MAG: magnesium chelatase subunit H [Anaerolineae bacterium]|nr:magnesium chelatase subunit H [Anaerolineae bacterium]
MTAKKEARFVYLTMDGGHNAALREAARLLEKEHGVKMHLALHSAAHLQDAAAWQRLEKDVAAADFIFICMIFGEEFVRPLERILDTAAPGKPLCAITSNPAIIYRTRLGKLNLKPAENSADQGMFQRWMQRLRPRKKGNDEGHRQTNLIKNLMKLMKYLPGVMRDLHTFVASHDYWIHSTPENLKRMMCLLLERYVPGFKGKLPVQDAIEYPDLAIYHPDAPAPFQTAAEYRRWREQTGRPVDNGRPGVWQGAAGLLTQRAIILSGNTGHLDHLIRDLEAQGIEARTTYSALLDFRPAIDTFLAGNHGGDLHKVDALLNTMGFPLVGGPAGTRPDQSTVTLHNLDVGYLDMIPLTFQRVEDWRGSDVGLNAMQVAMNIALPELDGGTEPVIFGGPTSTGEKFIAFDAEQSLAARRVSRRIRLHRKASADKKVAIVLFNFPPNLGNAGTAAFLDVFASLHRLLLEMQAAGYQVGDLPADAETFRRQVVEGNAHQHGTDGNVAALLPVEDYRRLFPWYSQIEKYWGYAPGELLTNGKAFYILGAHFGNVFIGMQPSFGYERDPMRLLMGKDAAPHHGFAAFYAWLNHVYDADAVVHFGTHGALEFMPGKQAGISADCWPHRLLGALPNFYYYCVNNPGEGSIARRRGAATLVSYMVPPMQQAGLYKGLRRLKDGLDQYHKRADAALLDDLRHQAEQLGLSVAAADDEHYAAALGHELIQVESRMIPLGLHTLGQAPAESELIDMLALVLSFNPLPGPAGSPETQPTLPALIARGHGWQYAALQEHIKTDATAQQRLAEIDIILREIVSRFVQAPRHPAPDLSAIHAYLLSTARVQPEALARLWPWLEDLMQRIIHDEEITGLLHSLDGGYILPSPGNDVVRNTHIVPTGRNIHALDPYRVPTPAAISAAQALVKAMLERLTAAEGQLPETVAMVLWGTDNLKSDGEGIAQCFSLLGVRPVEDELGSISDVALIPLAELGRPRIDLVMTISGIFRDLFQHQAGLLDKAVRLCAEADEPLTMNFVRKHTLAHAAELGISFDQATARVYCNASGSYGANVNHLVDSSTWENDDEISDVFLARKSFAYRQGGRWEANRAVMERSLATVAAAFQNIDSFEMGISDVDHYYEYLGGVTKSVEKLRGDRPAVLVADAISLNDRLSTLDQMVRLESRAKLLNPKWYEAMMQHGYEGVREIETRVSNTYGWSATADAVEGWVYNDVAETFLLDETMRERLARANPHATAAIARRLLEADARGFWEASDDMIDRLREIYGNLEDRLEGIAAG